METERLLLRPFKAGDAPAIQNLAGSVEIARNTFIPHPYKEGMAEEFIDQSKMKAESGEWANFAVILKKEDILIGSIGYKDIDSKHNRAELGYWIGKPYWGKGYATEAVVKLIQFGFEHLKLHRVYATPFGSNTASQKVLEKAGMKKEGSLKDHIYHFGEYHDLFIY
ncbi:MAG: GNAT family N-acetyltransferase, partial [Candidatus Halalkalibacterium sp. M3_1C_030]